MASDSVSAIKSVRLSAADYDINDIMSKNLTGNLATTDACYLVVMQREISLVLFLVLLSRCIMEE